MKLNLFLAAAMSLAATVACAQDGPPQGGGGPMMACRADVMKLCAKEAEAMDRPGIRACLIKNMDKVSSECHSMMESMKNGNGGPPPMPPAPPAPPSNGK